MLHALAKKLLTNAQKPEYGNLPVGTLTFAEPYPQLRFGDVAGIGQVTIDQTGNMIGFSPVERCTAGGETAWIPLELIKNIRLDPIGVGGARSHATTNGTAGARIRSRQRSRTTKTATA